MILVADSSALVALAACDSLTLLDEIFGQVIVPEAVFHEVVRADKFQSNRLKGYLYDKIRTVDMQRFVFLDAFADAGETEAMLLYKEVPQTTCSSMTSVGARLQASTRSEPSGLSAYCCRPSEWALSATLPPLYGKSPKAQFS